VKEIQFQFQAFHPKFKNFSNLENTTSKFKQFFNSGLMISGKIRVKYLILLLLRTILAVYCIFSFNMIKKTLNNNFDYVLICNLRWQNGPWKCLYLTLKKVYEPCLWFHIFQATFFFFLNIQYWWICLHVAIIHCHN